MKTDKWGQPLVPCKYCGTDTPTAGTRMCNGCWELDRRIRMQPELAEKILKETQK